MHEGTNPSDNEFATRAGHSEIEGFEGLFFARVTDYSDTTLVTRRLGNYPETALWEVWADW